MLLGWISVHRQLQEHWLWEDKPFSKGQAWIDLLMLANHADKKFLLGNELIEVKAGSFITSELKLMERWGWGKTKTRAFLDVLQKDGMIRKISDRKKTTIIIENYSSFQISETTDKPQTDHEQTASRPQADTNNNDNNVNNDNKNNIGASNDAPSTTKKRFTKPTLEEVSGYCKERNNHVDPQRFIDYYESNGWKVGRNPMKDWKAAVRTWEGKENGTAKRDTVNTEHVAGEKRKLGVYL